jgi:O-succinylhomoserine sulfhydrylase
MSDQQNNLHPLTKAIRIQTPATQQMEHSTPLFLTSSFRFEDAEEMRAAFADETNDNIYSRFSNPNVDEFIQKMCALEGAEAGFATATGMAAVFASMFALLKQGDHIISSSSIFGSTFTMVTKFLPRFGIEATLVSANDKDAWEKAIKPNTKMIYLETPTNPQLEILDLNGQANWQKNTTLFLT